AHGAALRGLRRPARRRRQLHARPHQAGGVVELGPLPGVQLPAPLHRHLVQRLRDEGGDGAEGPQADAGARGRPAHGRADQRGQALHVGLQRLWPAGLRPARRGAGRPAEAHPGPRPAGERGNHRLRLRRWAHRVRDEELQGLRMGLQHQRPAGPRDEAVLPRAG
ncbi:unnamed protein product, partial [Prorocentrum cordatum]